MNIKETILKLSKLQRNACLAIFMQPFVQKLIIPFGRDLTPQRWIFIIGCYNSGTTLLANVLRKHPQIGGLPNEGAFLTDSLPYPEQLGWPRMWCRCYDHVRINSEIANQKKAARIKRQWSIWFPKNTPNLIEKSISNAVRIPFLNKHFKPAYFIYMVRDGYAVAKGIQRKANHKRWNSTYKKTGYPIELCAEQWKNSDVIVQQKKELVEHFFPITYEKFTEKPQETLDAITQFLGLSPMPVDFLRSGWNIHEFSSTIKNMNEHSFSYLTDNDITLIEKVAGETLRQYGYEKPHTSTIS